MFTPWFQCPPPFPTTLKSAWILVSSSILHLERTAENEIKDFIFDGNPTLSDEWVGLYENYRREHFCEFSNFLLQNVQLQGFKFKIILDFKPIWDKKREYIGRYTSQCPIYCCFLEKTNNSIRNFFQPRMIYIDLVFYFAKFSMFRNIPHLVHHVKLSLN